MSNEQESPDDASPEGAEEPALEESVADAPLDLFPVCLLREGDPLPDAHTAYLIGRHGFAVQTETIAFRSIVPVSHIPSLAPITASATWRLPPIPAETVMQILKFFREVWKLHKSEAILLISFHERRGTFRLDAPPQRVSAGHIHYDMPPRAEGFLWVGTVHSHGSMHAFHSGTDTHDEEKFDGIHMTFGQVDRELVQIVASLAVGGQRFPQPVESILAGTVNEKRTITLPPVVPLYPTYAKPQEREEWPPVGGPKSPPLPSLDPTPPRHVPPPRRRNALLDLLDWLVPREETKEVPPPPRPTRAKKFAAFEDQPSSPRPVHVPIVYTPPPVLTRVETGYAVHVPDDVLPEDQEPLPEWIQQVTSASTARTYLPSAPQHFGGGMQSFTQEWPSRIGFQHPHGAPPNFERRMPFFSRDAGAEDERSSSIPPPPTLDKIENKGLREDRTEGADVPLTPKNTPWTRLATKEEEE